MNHGSLFSGIGGFDLAAQWMGWDNKFHCEWNEFGKKILNYYWPNAESYGDITKTDFTIWNGRVEILTGGFPCQPYSQAGKRLGKEDERHLWPEMLRAIKEIKPRWIVGENVYGIVNWSDGMVFEEVQADLENEGYSVQPYILPAASVNAPHQRDRVWFVAHSDDNGRKPRDGKSNGNCEGESDSKGIGERFRDEGIEHGVFKHATDTKSKRRGEGGKPRNSCIRKRSIQQGIKHDGNKVRGVFDRLDSEGSGYEPEFGRFPTQSPVCNGNDGISTELDGITFPKWRSESIKGGGNAIVPQVALQIFKAIELYENSNKQTTKPNDSERTI